MQVHVIFPALRHLSISCWIHLKPNEPMNILLQKSLLGGRAVCAFRGGWNAEVRKCLFVKYREYYFFYLFMSFRLPASMSHTPPYFASYTIMFSLFLWNMASFSKPMTVPTYRWERMWFTHFYNCCLHAYMPTFE